MALEPLGQKAAEGHPTQGDPPTLAEDEHRRDRQTPLRVGFKSEALVKHPSDNPAAIRVSMDPNMATKAPEAVDIPPGD